MALYIGIQSYFHDEWVNTNHTLESLEQEAKTFGDGESLRNMAIGSSWFENDIFYYIDTMGHYFLFRGITEFNKEHLKNKKTRKMEGSANFQHEYIE